MPQITLTTLQSLKLKGEKITMLTCYDATFAHAACTAGVEVLLVGDSLGMVLQGHDSTLPVTVADMAYHVASVKRGNQGAFIVADLPFMAYSTCEQTLANCALLMQAGAHMVKLEGAAWLAGARPPARRARYSSLCSPGVDPTIGEHSGRLQGTGPPGYPGTPDACRCHRPGASWRGHAVA